MALQDENIDKTVVEELREQEENPLNAFPARPVFSSPAGTAQAE